MEPVEEFSRIIYQDDSKNLQLRVVLGEFREIEYLHIRKYFQSYEGDWVPSSEGVSVPITIDIVIKLTDALLELCSNSEGDDLLHKHYIEKLQKSKLVLDPKS